VEKTGSPGKNDHPQVIDKLDGRPEEQAIMGIERRQKQIRRR
jgi:hypothetical protein